MAQVRWWWYLHFLAAQALSCALLQTCMEERVWSFPPGPWMVKLLQVCGALGEGRFARGAGLSGSGGDLCFTGPLVKQHAGGKREQRCGFPIFWALVGRDAGLAAVQGSHSTCTAAHGSGWGAVASHSSGFAFSGGWCRGRDWSLCVFMDSWTLNKSSLLSTSVRIQIQGGLENITSRSRSDWKGGTCDHVSAPCL